MADADLQEATNDPLRAISFYLEMNNVQNATFKGVSGGELKIEVVEYMQSGKAGNGGREFLPTKQPGKISYSNLTLKRGITSDLTLYNWIKDVADGKIKNSRQTGAITGYDDEGQEVFKLNFEKAWPCRYAGVEFDATSNEAKIEEVEIVAERFWRDK